MTLRPQYIGITPSGSSVDPPRLLSASDWSPKVAETGIVVLDEVFLSGLK